MTRLVLVTVGKFLVTGMKSRGCCCCWVQSVLFIRVIESFVCVICRSKSPDLIFEKWYAQVSAVFR